MGRPLVLALDEATEYHDFIRAGLQQAYGDEVEVRIEGPLKTIEQMIKHILEVDEYLSALILDQRLNETGDCDYIGSELAKAYRSYDSKIPIYILTSYPDDIDSMFSDIEYVLDKGHLTDDPSIERLSPRLRRHVDIYRDMVDIRKRKLDELLMKKISSPLTVDEAKELSELQFWRTRPIELEESILSDKLRESLDKKEEMIAGLESILNKES